MKRKKLYKLPIDIVGKWVYDKPIGFEKDFRPLSEEKKGILSGGRYNKEEKRIII